MKETHKIANIIAIVVIITGLIITSCSGNLDGDPEYCDISWNLDGGEWADGSLHPKQVEKNTYLDKPYPDPEKEEHTFGGWYTDAEFSIRYSFSKIVTADVALYAKWDSDVAIPPTTGPRYLIFTSDVHYGSNSSGDGSSGNGSGSSGPNAVASLFTPWMNKLKTIIPHADYMGFCGDNATANETGSAHWTAFGHLVTRAETFKTSGFIKNDNIFIPGNHEWQTTAGGDFPSIANKEVFPYNRLIYKLEDSGEYVRTQDYIIYTCPTGPYTTSFSNYSYGQYLEVRRTALAAYLASAPKDIPIFIMAHYPLHSISTSRVTNYGAEMINILNGYPNVVFFWGHNHSRPVAEQIHYDTILRPGARIRAQVGNSSTYNEMEINFTYLSPGGMRDTGYGDTSGNIISKGLVIKIEDGNYTFTHYDKDTNPMASTLLTLTKAQLTTGVK